MKISQISENQSFKDRIISLVDSLGDDEVLTTSELTEKLNLISANGEFCKIVSELPRKRVVIKGIRQWAYGTPSALQNLESKINRGSIENR
jgi:hypothetical protein